MHTVEYVTRALLWMLPAYVANGAPVLVAHLVRRAGRPLHPIDRGARFPDGERLFGDNKTIEGFAGGVIAGSTAGALMQALGLHTSASAFILSLGALTGDLAGAFIKRRLKLKPGDPAPLLDQLDFVAGAIAFYAAYASVPLEYVVVVVVVTPLLHLATNAAAYILGLKRVPW